MEYVPWLLFGSAVCTYIERFVLSEWIDEWRARLPWFEVTSMLIEKNMMLYNHWIITLVF